MSQDAADREEICLSRQEWSNDQVHDPFTNLQHTAKHVETHHHALFWHNKNSLSIGIVPPHGKPRTYPYPTAQNHHDIPPSDRRAGSAWSLAPWSHPCRTCVWAGACWSRKWRGFWKSVTTANFTCIREREREGDIDLLSKCILVFLILISFGFGRFSISDWFLIVCGPCVCTLSLL